LLLEALKFVIPVGDAHPMMRHLQVLIKFYSLLAKLEEVEGVAINPGEPGNLSVPIRFYYRIRELNF
jgi:hypothetical protein